jgi:flavin-binding protein dodecin
LVVWGPRLYAHGDRTATAEAAGVEMRHRTAIKRRRNLAAVKIIELIGTSSKSSDDAVQQALKEAKTSLRNIKAVDLVSTGLRGDNLDEWRAHVRVAFLVERVNE